MIGIVCLIPCTLYRLAIFQSCWFNMLEKSVVFWQGWTLAWSLIVINARLNKLCNVKWDIHLDAPSLWFPSWACHLVSVSNQPPSHRQCQAPVLINDAFRVWPVILLSLCRQIRLYDWVQSTAESAFLLLLAAICCRHARRRRRRLWPRHW